MKTLRVATLVLSFLIPGQLAATTTGSYNLQLAQNRVDQPKTPKKKKTHSGKEIVPKNESVEEDSSEFHRQELTASIVVEPVGFAPYPGFGFAGGYYLTPDDLVEFSYHSASLDFTLFKLESTMAEVRLKHWFGNSFYVNGGLGLRSLKASVTLEPLTGTTDYTSSATASSFGGSLVIGNRWQWETFTMGCDWIGFFVPLSTTEAKVTAPSSTDYSEEDRQSAEDDMNDLALSGSPMFLRFYLGVSF